MSINPNLQLKGPDLSAATTATKSTAPSTTPEDFLNINPFDKKESTDGKLKLASVDTNLPPTPTGQLKTKGYEQALQNGLLGDKGDYAGDLVSFSNKPAPAVGEGTVLAPKAEAPAPPVGEGTVLAPKAEAAPPAPAAAPPPPPPKSGGLFSGIFNTICGDGQTNGGFLGNLSSGILGDGIFGKLASIVVGNNQSGGLLGGITNFLFGGGHAQAPAAPQATPQAQAAPQAAPQPQSAPQTAPAPETPAPAEAPAIEAKSGDGEKAETPADKPHTGKPAAKPPTGKPAAKPNAGKPAPGTKNPEATTTVVRPKGHENEAGGPLSLITDDHDGFKVESTYKKTDQVMEGTISDKSKLKSGDTLEKGSGAGNPVNLMHTDKNGKVNIAAYDHAENVTTTNKSTFKSADGKEINYNTTSKKEDWNGSTYGTHTITDLSDAKAPKQTVIKNEGGKWVDQNKDAPSNKPSTPDDMDMGSPSDTWTNIKKIFQ